MFSPATRLVVQKFIHANSKEIHKQIPHKKGQ